MNLQDVITLKEAGAKFTLLLCRSRSSRSRHSDYDLFLQIQTVAFENDTPVFSTIAVEAPKHYVTLERFLEKNALDFNFLTTDNKPLSSSKIAAPLSGRSMCLVCQKFDFTDSSGCKNSSVFSSGLWSCNLDVSK